MFYMSLELLWISYLSISFVSITIFLVILMPMNSKFKIFPRVDSSTRAWVIMVSILSTQSFFQSIHLSHIPLLQKQLHLLHFLHSVSVDQINGSDKVLHSALSFLESFDVLNKTNDVVTHCRHCLNGKMHQLPFNKYTSISTMPLELMWCMGSSTCNFCEWL